MDSSHLHRPRYQKPKKTKLRTSYSISLKHNEWWSALEINGNRFLKSSWCPLAAIQKAVWHFHLPLSLPVPAALGQCPKQWQAFHFLALILQNNAAKRKENLTNWLTIFFLTLPFHFYETNLPPADLQKKHSVINLLQWTVKEYQNANTRTIALVLFWLTA